MDWFDKWRAARHLRKSPYQAALAALPRGLQAHWRENAPQEFEGIRTDALFFVRAAEGLVHFFDVAGRSSQPCALPSRAADSVWHAWLRFDALGLEGFCIAHFGSAVPHPEPTMRAPYLAGPGDARPRVARSMAQSAVAVDDGGTFGDGLALVLAGNDDADDIGDDSGDNSRDDAEDSCNDVEDSCNDDEDCCEDASDSVCESSDDSDDD